jgi:hypothetical protein
MVLCGLGSALLADSCWLTAAARHVQVREKAYLCSCLGDMTACVLLDEAGLLRHLAGDMTVALMVQALDFIRNVSQVCIPRPSLSQLAPVLLACVDVIISALLARHLCARR